MVIILDQETQRLIGWISDKILFNRTQYYTQKYGMYIYFTIIIFGKSKEGSTVLPKPASKYTRKYEA